ncbi:MAG: hypothetical protein VST68_01005, partial [Nitrospirota bacterium]|nr:hypothetical protein [Nitrospirota bacterium]
NKVRLMQYIRIGAYAVAWCIILMVVVDIFTPLEAQAIPPFSRKYDVNCSVCHTKPPRLNTFGERFLENGYQMPGTEDGGVIKKRRLGDLTLDTVGNYLGARLRGNVQSFDFEKDGDGSAGNPEDRTEIGFPQTFSLYTAGTLTTNVGIFTEMLFNFKGSVFTTERAFVTFDNVGSYDVFHIRIGRIDPSAFSSYPNRRQQLDRVRGDSANQFGNAFKQQTINRIPLVPNAFGSKFYGLFKRTNGQVISPDKQSLFFSDREVGLDIHGRPFGDWFLYQVGILNGAEEGFGDSNNPKDWYVMFRVDYGESRYFTANLSTFAYFGNNNAKVTSVAEVSRRQYGLAGNVRYKMVDIYGAFVIDHVADLPPSLASSFDDTATGLTLEADVIATDRLLLSMRYDHLDAGGTRATKKSNSLLAFQVKYFLSSNIALYLRDDFNVQKDEGGSSGPRTFRNGFFIGADLDF